MDISKFELGHVEIVMVKPSEVTSEKALSVCLVMSAEDASAYLVAHPTPRAADGANGAVKNVGHCPECGQELQD